MYIYGPQIVGTPSRTMSDPEGPSIQMITTPLGFYIRELVVFLETHVSSSVPTFFQIRDYDVLPKEEVHRTLQVF